ncbi:MAG: type II toxin-antitoxin system HicB family antitoxin [Pirellulales bacterium]
MHYKIPLVLSPQPEGGFTVTSPMLPELVTEGDTVNEALENVRDAVAAVVEIYEDLGQEFPSQARIDTVAAPIHFETVVVGT